MRFYVKWWVGGPNLIYPSRKHRKRPTVCAITFSRGLPTKATHFSTSHTSTRKWRQRLQWRGLATASKFYHSCGRLGG